MLNLTLTGPNNAFEKILIFFVRGWDWNLENLNANCFHYWCLHTIDVVRCIVYLILTAGVASI